MGFVKIWHKVCFYDGMKEKALITLALVFGMISSTFAIVPMTIDSQSNLPELEHNAFKAGEKLTYRVHYGIIDAGEAKIELKESPYTFSNRSTYHAVGTGNSIGAFDLFFKVRDTYETYIDREGVFPWYFKRRVDEGGYKISQDYTFNHNEGSVSTQKDETHTVPTGVQDIISAFYYARTFDYSNAQKGDIFEIPTFLDDEMMILKIKYKGKETIKIRDGKYDCIKFVPVVQKGRIWKDESDLNIWISDDENKIPVLCKTKILVGSIKMELTDYSGLAHKISKVKK